MFLDKEDYLRGGLSGDFKGDFRGEPFRIGLEDVNLRLNGTFGADEWPLWLAVLDVTNEATLAPLLTLPLELSLRFFCKEGEAPLGSDPSLLGIGSISPRSTKFFSNLSSCEIIDSI